MITCSTRGNFNNTKKLLNRIKNNHIYDILNKYGREGVQALSAATPKDTGKTADSWEYSITKKSDGYELTWNNTNLNKGVPIAILIQYGHVTSKGTWVEGYDYINPALKNVLSDLKKELRRDLTNG